MFWVANPSISLRSLPWRCGCLFTGTALYCRLLLITPQHKSLSYINSISPAMYTHLNFWRIFSRPLLISCGRTSVMFVSISFIVLMMISLAWLVFYYIQRFRYLHAKDRLSVRISISSSFSFRTSLLLFLSSKSWKHSIVLKKTVANERQSFSFLARIDECCAKSSIENPH